MLPLVRVGGGSIQKESQNKREPPIKEQVSGEQIKPGITPSRRNVKSPVTCYKCGKSGHMSFNCGKGNSKPAQGYLLCMTLYSPIPCHLYYFFPFPFFPFYFCVPTPKIDLLMGEVSRNYLVLSHSYLRLVQVFVSVCFVWILPLIIT